MKSFTAITKTLEYQELLAVLSYWVTIDGETVDLVGLSHSTGVPTTVTTTDGRRPPITEALMATLETMYKFKANHDIRRGGINPTGNQISPSGDESNQEKEKMSSQQFMTKLLSDVNLQLEVIKPLAHALMTTEFSIETYKKANGSSKHFPGLESEDEDLIKQWNLEYAAAFSSSKNQEGALATEIVCKSMGDLVTEFSKAVVSVDRAIMPAATSTETMTVNQTTLETAGTARSYENAAKQVLSAIPKNPNNPFAKPLLSARDYHNQRAPLKKQSN